MRHSYRATASRHGVDTLLVKRAVPLRPSDRGAATYIAPQFSDSTERLPFVKGMMTVRSTKDVVLPFLYRTREPKIVARRQA